jgi:phosphoribosylformylglycinamidine (FGAM) synthase-like enzyme
VKADLPLSTLSGSAPEYDRPWENPPRRAAGRGRFPQVDPIDGLKALIGSPNYCSRAWVYEQYDTMVMADTCAPPAGARGSSGCTAPTRCWPSPRTSRRATCAANPVEGGKQAVAEAFATSVPWAPTPLATTDNLNFGNPEKPEIMGQFVGAIKGHRRGGAALDMPIVSGNVSLYNETDGQAILPTPTIGAVGLILYPHCAPPMNRGFLPS